MSFEGYYQVRCKNKHYYTQDVYSFDSGSKCSYCDADIEDKNMVDETNFESEGYDPNFSDGCDYLTHIWKKDLDNLKNLLDESESILKNCLINSPLNPFDRADLIKNFLTKLDNLRNSKNDNL
jgi:hypothetical protein